MRRDQGEAQAATVLPSATARDDEERRAVSQALLEANGVVSVAAARLGLSRQALYRRMERLGVVIEKRLSRG